MEEVRRVETNQLVSNFFDLAAGSLWRNRHRHDNLLGPQSPGACYGGLHCCPARQTIVDQDHQLSFQILLRALAAISPLATLQLQSLGVGFINKLMGADSKSLDQGFIKNN